MLIEPTVELCKLGHVINKDVANWAQRFDDKIRSEPDFRYIVSIQLLVQLGSAFRAINSVLTRQVNMHISVVDILIGGI